MRGVESVIEPDDVLPKIERAAQFVGRVVGGRQVGVDARQPRHRFIGAGQRAPVRGDAIGRDDVAGETGRAVRRRAGSRLGRVAQRAIVRRAHDAVSPAQTEREIAAQVGQRRQGAPGWIERAPDVLPLLSAEEEELVLPDGAADAVAKVVEAQLAHVGRKEVARVQFVVAQKFEQAAVKLVAAAARGDVDGRAGLPAVLGGEVGRCES